MKSNFINEISSKIFDIYDCKTHNELLAYFELIKKYGLIESKYLQNINSIYESQNKILTYSIVPLCSFTCWSFFQKKIFFNISWIGLACILYSYRKQYKLYKSEIDQLSNLYKSRIDNFKKTRDFRSLNPDFLEEIIDIPEISLIQFSYKY